MNSPSPARARNAVQYQRPPLYPKQLDAIFCGERYGVIEASTKTGKTTGCIIWLLEQALQGRKGQNYWWVAPILGQAKIAFRRLLRAMPRHLYTPNYSDLTITIKGIETVIWFKGADNGDSLYGEDVYAAVVDEATRCKEEAWWAIRSTLTATQGPVRIIGNVKGRKNWAYNLARLAQAGAAGMHYAKLTIHDAIDAGIIPATEVADARAALPEAVFNELYLAEPSDNAGNPFGGDGKIAACIGPLSSLPVVCWGIDLAKSIDWTVVVGLDINGHVAKIERWQGPWEETIDRIVALCGSLPALVDSTGVGDPVLEALQKRSRKLDPEAGRATPGKYEGFKFSESSKQQLMERLAVAIQQRTVTFPLGVIADEAKEFEFQYTRTGVRYSAPDGLHDDAVYALALAVLAHSALSSRTLKAWGGVEEPEPISEAEQKRIDNEQLKAAEQAVLDALDTARWFGN